MVIWAPLDPLNFGTHHELENENIVKSMGVMQRILSVTPLVLW